MDIAGKTVLVPEKHQPVKYPFRRVIGGNFYSRTEEEAFNVVSSVEFRRKAGQFFRFKRHPLPVATPEAIKAAVEKGSD